MKVPGTEVSIKESDLCDDDTGGADKVVNKMLVLEVAGLEWNMEYDMVEPGRLVLEVVVRSDDSGGSCEMEVDSTSLVM